MADPSSNRDAIAISPVQRRGMRMGVLQSCFGAVGYVAITNGTIFLYLNAQEISSQRIVFYLSAPSLVMAALLLPLAYLGDRRGKRRVGLVGGVMELLGYILLTVSAWLPPVPREIMSAAGIMLHATGATAYVSTWFALVSPIVPEPMRGRFFGRLRTTWQAFALGFAVFSAMMLDEQSPIWVFQLVLATIALFVALRLPIYAGIPEMEPSGPSDRRFMDILLSVIRMERFMSFSAYGFLLYLFTGGVLTLLGLVEKRVLNYGDDTILWLGILYLVGGMAGFYFGGLMVDHWGTKPVFLISHFGFSAMMLLFLARGIHPAATMAVVAMVNFGFGAVLSCSTIAMTTEMLTLMPSEHKAMSSSFNIAMLRGGSALSGLMVTWVLDLKVLASEWTLAGRILSHYDAILLGFAVMVLVMVVTLGLVPSVVGKAEWYPRQGA
jgi:MFS family permease